MGPQARGEYLARMRDRYPMANRAKRSELVTEVVAMTGYHRKAVIRLLRRPARPRPRRRPRAPGAVRPSGWCGALRAIWQAAGYPVVGPAAGAAARCGCRGRGRRLRLSAATETAASGR